MAREKFTDQRGVEVEIVDAPEGTWIPPRCRGREWFTMEEAFGKIPYKKPRSSGMPRRRREDKDGDEGETTREE